MEAIHQHRSTGLKQQNKSHKHGRHKSKGSLEKHSKGKVLDLKPTNKQRIELKRQERRNQAQQIRHKKRTEYLEKRRGICEAPFLVAVLSLNEKINTADAIEFLKGSDPEAEITMTSEGHVHLSSPRLKQKFVFAHIRSDNLFDKLDLLKVSTTVLFLASVDGIDYEGETILSASSAQGLPTVSVAVTDLEKLPLKKWHEAKGQIETDLGKWLPQDKVMQMVKSSDGLNILRKIALQKQKSILFRDRRPYMLGESVEFSETEEGYGTLSVTGYLRGKNLSVNSLIHIPGWGDFQMSQIDSVPAPGSSREYRVLEVANPAIQESLDSENIPDPMDAEQNWPTEEDIAEAKKETKKVKKVPKGWSDYQAAWIPDCDAVELESDLDSEEDDTMEVHDQTVSSEEEEAETCTVTSELAIAPDKYDNDMDMEEEKNALEKLIQAKENEQFPDEMDTPQDIPARDRFARYRGLKSFRTSPWDTKENLPYDYSRIFQFENFQRTKAAALSLEQNGAEVGWYIKIHILKVPTVNYLLKKTQPIVIYGLLPHEKQMSVINCVLKRTSSYKEPLASKEKLLFQVGFRRFRCCPIFSQHSNGNKHKYERFFQPDSTVVATTYAPITFPPAAVIVFKEHSDGTMEIVARGSLLSVNPDRVIVKRVVLSGHPMKILKRSAIIRFMFYNREDIDWFKPVELRTKYGRRGHIKEALGTHGHMKCVFNNQLKSQDTVLLNLYKRIFPKWTYDTQVNFVPTE